MHLCVTMHRVQSVLQFVHACATRFSFAICCRPGGPSPRWRTPRSPFFLKANLLKEKALYGPIQRPYHILEEVPPPPPPPEDARIRRDLGCATATTILAIGEDRKIIVLKRDVVLAMLSGEPCRPNNCSK